jgi:hypothetical protein
LQDSWKLTMVSRLVGESASLIKAAEKFWISTTGQRK